MGEVLFRGKRKDTSEWVFGDLIVSKDKYYIHLRANAFQVDGVLSRLIVLYKVIPETVEQFTGLADKNGTKIFEGDILRGFAYPFRDGEGKHNYYAEVVWFENSPAFGLVTHKNPKSNVVGISEGNCEYMENWETFLWEVIGNIYDNKELSEND
jgi:uncharacterized phage protein (TIGR01671 family)